MFSRGEEFALMSVEVSDAVTYWKCRLLRIRKYGLYSGVRVSSASVACVSACMKLMSFVKQLFLFVPVKFIT